MKFLNDLYIVIDKVNIKLDMHAFTSNALFPKELMPEWLQAIADWNPITHTIGPIRTMTTNGWLWDKMLPDVAIMVAMTLAVMAIATLVFRRSIS